MKKRRLVSAVVYATSTITVVGIVDFLYGAAPDVSRLVYLLIAGIALFGLACALSFFTPRWATICALCAAALLWPLLAPEFGRMNWGRNLGWLIRYEPDTPMAILSLLVSSIYSIRQLRFLRTGTDSSERRMGWALLAAVLYGVATPAAANWRSIWDWCFKLRYGG